MRFQMGLHTDLFNRVQPSETYSDMQNGIFDLGYQSIQNERGTTKLTLIPYTPIGSITLNDGTAVIFSTDLMYSKGSIFVENADGVDAVHTVTINGTDVGKTDIVVTATILTADDAEATAAKYLAALMASSTFLAEYRAELATWDSGNETVMIRTTNGTSAPADFNTISIDVSSSNGGGSSTWVNVPFADGSASIRDSAIGTFNGSGYTAVHNDHGYAVANKMDFQDGTFIEGTNRINPNLDILIYWTDDVNPPRFANITTPISGEFDVNRLLLFPNIDEVAFFTLDSIQTGGILRTGAYYIAAAYVDDDGTRTNYFVVSPPLFVNDESDSSSPDTFDGAIPDTVTNKSITFSLTNLDENHDFVRLAVIKNAAVSLLPDVVIPSGGVLNYTYTGTETVVEGALEDIVVNRIAYDKAKTIRQLDGRLYLGNLKGRSDIGYQKYANNIKLTGVTKIIDGETFLNYKDAKVAIESRTFRRDEVYAFYIAWVLTDGGESKAYHIPGRETVTGELAIGTVTFGDAPSSRNSAIGEVTYSGTLSKSFIFGVSIDGVNTNVSVSDELSTAAEVCDVIRIGLNNDATFAATYIASSNGAILTLATNDSIADPATYNGNAIVATSGVGITATETITPMTSGIDSETAVFASGVSLELDGADTVTTTADIAGGDTGISIATKMETALNIAGGNWVDYNTAPGFVRVDNVITITADASGPAFNRLLTFLANSVTRTLGAVTTRILAPVTGIDGAGDYYDGNEDVAVAAPGQAEVDDLTLQDTNFADSKLYHFSGHPDDFYNMGFWENVDEYYPNGEDWEVWEVVDGVGAQVTVGNVSLEGENIRHHRFPHNDSDMFFEGTSISNDYLIQGFKLSDIFIPDDIALKVKGFKIYYAERTFLNKTVLDQGLALYASVNVDDIATQNRASDHAAEDVLSRKVLEFHPFKAMTERTNVGGLSFLKAVAKINPSGAYTDYRCTTDLYVAPSGDTSIGLHTDGEPLIREIVGKGYIPALVDDVSLASNGFTKLNYKNGHGESKLLIELDNDMPVDTLASGDSMHNYIFNLCMFRTDVYVSFMLQNLVWTGHWQEGIAALGTGPAARQHSVNETPNLYGGDTFIGFQTHKVHGERFTQIVTVTGGGGTLGIDINEGNGVVPYDVAFNADADTTADDWLTAHVAALGALGIPITATKTGTAEITLISDMPFTAVDGGATMVASFAGSDGTASKLLTVSGGSGTLSIKIGDVLYTEVFAADADTTAANWVATHAAALAVLDNPIIATDAGTAIIKLVSGISFKVQDVGGTVMTFTITEAWGVLTHDAVCESDYNFGMRHQGVEAWELYYPKSPRADVITPSNYPDGILVDEDVDNFWGYDPAFSSQANIKYPIPFDGSEVSDELPTRVIRSAEDVGGVDDTFREFLPIDFIDLPRNRGELIKLQAMGQILIPHMERGLLRTRGREQLDTGTLSAFIGSGDIFAVSPDEIISTDPGYGGLQDQGASIVTEHGYFFVDRAAGKVFLLTDQLHEISAKGMQNYFEDNLDGGGTLSVAWDPELRRIMLTKSGSSTTDFTLSFLPESKIWVSHHDYQPIFYVSTLTKLNSYFLACLHSHSSGDYGKFYETIQEFELSFIENAPLDASKQVAALIIDTTSLDGSTENRKDTFDKVQITNSYQDTGLITLVDFPATGWNSRRTKRTHKINQLRDTLNVAPGSSSQFPAWALRKRLVDNYHIVRLLYSNTNSYLLRLFDAQLNLRPAKR